MSRGARVLIAGAGPVGLTMAAELARFGVAVRIVDKSAQRTDKSKALVVWSRTLELLDRGGGIGAVHRGRVQDRRGDVHRRTQGRSAGSDGRRSTALSFWADAAAVGD